MVWHINVGTPKYSKNKLTFHNRTKDSIWCFWLKMMSIWQMSSGRRSAAAETQFCFSVTKYGATIRYLYYAPANIESQNQFWHQGGLYKPFHFPFQKSTTLLNCNVKLTGWDYHNRLHFWWFMFNLVFHLYSAGTYIQM